MGVKSTQRLTRAEAEDKFVDLYMETMRRNIRALAILYSNDKLEDKLEEMDDLRAGGESFNNYRIVED